MLALAMDWNFATTLIGSLPYSDPAEAVDAVMGAGLSCPSWPQLSGRGYTESMYVQTGERLPGLRVEGDKMAVDLGDYDPTEAYMAILGEDLSYFEASREHNAGLYELMGRDVSGSTAVKGQVTGPISEGLQVQDLTGRSVIYDESYCEIVRKTVNMSARWQAGKLKELNPNVIMFFDEPSLSLLGTPFASVSADDAVRYIDESIEGVDAFTAIHCCGNTDWPMVLRTRIDILNFDAYAYGRALTLYPKEVSDFLERGGSLAWGIVPNNELAADETPESLADRVDGHMKDLEAKGVSMDLLIRRSLVTPQCGLGGTDPKLVGTVLKLLKETAEELRRRHL